MSLTMTSPAGHVEVVNLPPPPVPPKPLALDLRPLIERKRKKLRATRQAG